MNKQNKFPLLNGEKDESRERRYIRISLPNIEDSERE
jgi:hypothetical protein